MIRDECPGTAAALHEACPDALSDALRYYTSMSDNEKTELHTQALEDFEARLDIAQEAYSAAQKALGPAPVEKKCRSKIDTINNKIEVLQHELKVEQVRLLKAELAKAKRLVKLEKTFQV